MNHPLNIAHRGFSSKFPENTMIAFDEALKCGADGFECDLRLTADGEIVVFHDDDLKRLCGTSGSIEKMTWAEIQKLKVFKKEKVPLLDDVLQNFQPKAINLEIKHSSRDAVVTEAVLRKLTKVRTSSRIIISSFSVEVLKALDVMDPKRDVAELGVLVETTGIQDLPKLSKDLHANTWNPPKQILRSPWHKRWEKENLKPLWLWTVDEPDQWQAALESKLSVEAIITNKPDAFGQFLSRFTPPQ